MPADLPALTIEQDTRGYRYSLEPFLIADFLQTTPGMRLLDVGTGCGVIPLLLLKQQADLAITAIEIQQSLYDVAARNVRANAAEAKIRLMHGDFLTATLENAPFDAVLSNPPFRKNRTGRINPNAEKAIARHEIALDLASLVRTSAKHLTARGRLVLTYPTERLDEVLAVMEKQRLHPSRLRFIHGTEQAQAKIFMVEGVLGQRSDCVVEPPLIVYHLDGTYTQDMERIYASFDHHHGTDDLGKK